MKQHKKYDDLHWTRKRLLKRLLDQGGGADV